MLERLQIGQSFSPNADSVELVYQGEVWTIEHVSESLFPMWLLRSFEPLHGNGRLSFEYLVLLKHLTTRYAGQFWENSSRLAASFIASTRDCCSNSFFVNNNGKRGQNS